MAVGKLVMNPSYRGRQYHNIERAIIFHFIRTQRCDRKGWLSSHRNTRRGLGVWVIAHSRLGLRFSLLLPKIRSPHWTWLPLMIYVSLRSFRCKWWQRPTRRRICKRGIRRMLILKKDGYVVGLIHCHVHRTPGWIAASTLRDDRWRRRELSFHVDIVLKIFTLRLLNRQELGRGLCGFVSHILHPCPCYLNRRSIMFLLQSEV